jgi:drug/metabolite transporter (DMT)-like permease
MALACTALAMLAFAANSLLCRQALAHSAIDPATFTTVRIASGALTLWLIVRRRRGVAASGGSWPASLALFVYAAAFSFAYTQLTAATGALLLFGAVQVTMVGVGLAHGERLRGLGLAGFAVALLGLVALLLPGLSAPPWSAAALMLSAGAAWGVYSLGGRGQHDPLGATAGNFARALLPAIALSAATITAASADPVGLLCAVGSGAVASGVGYAIWYAALPHLSTTAAATAQLSVPIVAALAAAVVLDEPLTIRVATCSAIVLGGIALVLFGGRDKA